MWPQRQTSHVHPVKCVVTADKRQYMHGTTRTESGDDDQCLAKSGAMLALAVVGEKGSTTLPRMRPCASDQRSVWYLPCCVLQAYASTLVVLRRAAAGAEALSLS